jgi:hypothetical protein
MACVNDPIDPANMTPEERSAEVADILEQEGHAYQPTQRRFHRTALSLHPLQPLLRRRGSPQRAGPQRARFITGSEGACMRLTSVPVPLRGCSCWFFGEDSNFDLRAIIGVRSLAICRKMPVESLLVVTTPLTQAYHTIGYPCLAIHSARASVRFHLMQRRAHHELTANQTVDCRRVSCAEGFHSFPLRISPGSSFVRSPASSSTSGEKAGESI